MKQLVKLSFKYWFVIVLMGLVFTLTGCSMKYGGVANGITQKEITLAGEKVEIGNFNLGAGESKFKPEVKLNKWGDETSIRVWSEEKVEDKATEKDGKVISKTKDGKKEFNFYSTKFEDNDAFEFEIILKEKPKTNVISLKIDLTGIECYYQPELTQQEKDEGAFRPENVIGSYACYHESKSGDYSKMGGKNYMAGKAFHIYRPQIEDASGVKVWGELNIQGNNLTVTIPQDFLDKAVYPVRHAMGLTFGFTGASTAANTITLNKDRLTGYLATPSNSGVVTSISIYGKGTGGYLKCSLYADENTLINPQSEAKLPGANNAWITANIESGPTIVADTAYWITCLIDYVDYSNRFSVNSDYFGGSNYTRVNQDFNLGTYPTFPASFTPSLNADRILIYATYEEAAPPSTIGDNSTTTIKTGTLQIKNGTLNIK